MNPFKRLRKSIPNYKPIACFYYTFEKRHIIFEDQNTGKKKLMEEYRSFHNNRNFTIDVTPFIEDYKREILNCEDILGGYEGVFKFVFGEIDGGNLYKHSYKIL